MIFTKKGGWFSPMSQIVGNCKSKK